jgi:hypothetical protein
MNYEKWSAKPPHKSYQLNYIGVASGYQSGNLTTLTVQLYACSLEEAKRYFDKHLEESKLVNLSDYHICKKG